MKLRTLVLALATTVAAASALLAVDLFATRESVTTVANEAKLKLEALRAVNQEDAAFLQSLSADAIFAKRLFALIRTNDSSGAQTLLQSKFSGSTVRILKLESDFKLSFARTRRGGGCVTFCFASDSSCPFDGATVPSFRVVSNRSCEESGITL